MNKTVIANWGTAQQGKSNTVKRIAKEILAHYPKATSQPAVIDFTFDIKVVITIGKITIGIESQGDPSSRLFQSLKEFSKMNCDLIICSTRTSGSTVEAVNALNKTHEYDIIWATNYRSNEKDKSLLNELSAKQIFELLEKILAGVI